MQGSPVPEPAVAVGEDPRSYARLMSAVYDATMAGNRAPARPREVIGDSWQRMLARGIDPDVQTAPVVETGALEMLRRSSGLMEVLDEISHGLESLVAEGENILVVADAQGRVLWRSGSPAVLVNADRLGFVEGAHWGEGTVGTNAIGTALVSQRAVQVFSAEHFLRSHHPWTCAGAPDPGSEDRTGHRRRRRLGPGAHRAPDDHRARRRRGAPGRVPPAPGARPHAEPAAGVRRPDPRADGQPGARRRHRRLGRRRRRDAAAQPDTAARTTRTRPGPAGDAGPVRRRAAARRVAGAARHRRRRRPARPARRG